jgi:hypothetical protein
MFKTIALMLIICAATATAQHSLDSLKWLSGHWVHTDGTAIQEEYWMVPDGGMMLGVHRDVRHGENTFFEYLRIAEIDGGLYYHASPGGDTETIFRADSTADSYVRFVNQEHDYPQRIMYELEPSGNLVARISDARGGNIRTWEFRKKGE